MAGRYKNSSQLNVSQDNESSRDSQDGSQLLDTSKLAELQNHHKANVKTRRRAVETRLHQNQEQGYAELRRRAEAEKAAYEADLKAAQRPHLKDIKELLARKKYLEQEIQKSREEMERAQMAVSQQMYACIKARVEALSK